MSVHESYQLERTGAKWYVVKDGERVSDGYHQITVKGHGRFEGKLGARTIEKPGYDGEVTLAFCEDCWNPEGMQ